MSSMDKKKTEWIDRYIIIAQIQFHQIRQIAEHGRIHLL